MAKLRVSYTSRSLDKNLCDNNELGKKLSIAFNATIVYLNYIYKIHE